MSLKSQGKGNKNLRADPLTAEEIEMLHKQNILGSATPESLLHTVWINNGVFFGLRGRQDHTNLLWGDIELKVTSSGREYLEFNERSTKTRSGQRGAYRKVTPKAFATEDENCPVKMYKTYTSHRPSDLLNPDSRFYLQPLKSPSGQIWYSHQAVGKTKLGQIMNVLAERGNIEGRKVNHSTRKTFAATLIQAGRPPTEVAQLAGWKNVQTVNEYSVPSMNQQEETSDIISNVMLPQPSKEVTTTNEVLNLSSDQVQMNSINNEMNYCNKRSSNPYAFMCGATISGGTFNINIFSVKGNSVVLLKILRSNDLTLWKKLNIYKYCNSK
ncbi:uncharacterized protein LOC123536945 [Mercenaria mercenaria]|uniref:uncharacterized protein LOC123536945 n=1 Tax=Mercenaria mercenaria TaxID=6596 RepID=UPI00234FAFD5|nr:uncharacterized protein LOC123536945 [Mercenaria mercenaria]